MSEIKKYKVVIGYVVPCTRESICYATSEHQAGEVALRMFFDANRNAHENLPRILNIQEEQING